jgi:hypothetical protein
MNLSFVSGPAVCVCSTRFSLDRCTFRRRCISQLPPLLSRLALGAFPPTKGVFRARGARAYVNINPSDDGNDGSAPRPTKITPFAGAHSENGPRLVSTFIFLISTTGTAHIIMKTYTHTGAPAYVCSLARLASLFPRLGAFPRQRENAAAFTNSHITLNAD